MEWFCGTREREAGKEVSDIRSLLLLLLLLVLFEIYEQKSTFLLLVYN
jgi:hypothetical protein